MEPKATHRSEMVRILIDEKRELRNKYGKEHLEKAIDTARKYSASFEDASEEESVGVGHVRFWTNSIFGKVPKKDVM